MIGIKKFKKYFDFKIVNFKGGGVTKESDVIYDRDGVPDIVPVLIVRRGADVGYGYITINYSTTSIMKLAREMGVNVSYVSTRELYIDWSDPENIRVTMAYQNDKGILQKINKVFKSKP